jgi:hypothetical protein
MGIRHLGEIGDDGKTKLIRIINKKLFGCGMD